MVTKVYSKRTVKSVINDYFTFSDLSPRFKGVDSSTGNIFCPFHENHDTPAAKMYWDSEREIWILHCFGQCHRNFTAYDYVDLVLCTKYQKYESPLQFLRMNMPEIDLGRILDNYQKQTDEYITSAIEEKRIYIDNTFYETGNIIDFIERLYTA